MQSKRNLNAIIVKIMKGLELINFNVKGLTYTFLYVEV